MRSCPTIFQIHLILLKRDHRAIKISFTRVVILEIAHLLKHSNISSKVANDLRQWSRDSSDDLFSSLTPESRYASRRMMRLITCKITDEVAPVGATTRPGKNGLNSETLTRRVAFTSCTCVSEFVPVSNPVSTRERMVIDQKFARSWFHGRYQSCIVSRPSVPYWMQYRSVYVCARWNYSHVEIYSWRAYPERARAEILYEETIVRVFQLFRNRCEIAYARYLWTLYSYPLK